MKNMTKMLMLAVFLVVAGLLMVSCQTAPQADRAVYTWTFVNNSSHQISITDASFSPGSFTLAVGARREFTTFDSSITYLYSPSENVRRDSATTPTGATITFVNR